MSTHIPASRITDVAQIVSAPTHQPPVDRTFELPGRVYGLTIAAYLAFLGMLTAAFMAPGLAIPTVIFLLYIAMAFGVPAVWSRLGADDGAKRLSWSRFMSQGIMTHDGPVAAGPALIQVLILPVALLIWGSAFVIIAALQ